MQPQQLLTEIPSSLKQLARLVARGFYDIEYSLIVDMLGGDQLFFIFCEVCT